MAKPLPASKETTRTGCCVGVFFILATIPFFGFFAWKAYLDVRCFTQYRQTSCRIVNKRMIQHSGSKGPTFRPEFDIEFVDDQGRTVQTSGYDTWEVSRGDRSSQQQILNSYQVGQSYPCWYDPRNPQRAVLVRRISWMYLLALIPLAFLALGVLIIRGSLRDNRRSVSPETKAFKKKEKAVPGSHLVSTPKTGVGQVLPVSLTHEGNNEPGIGCLIFSVVFLASGIVVYLQWARSLWGLAAVLVVLGLIGSILCIMTWAGQRRVRSVRVEVSAADLVPGQRLECWVCITGQTALNGLTVRLVCEERATYQQGTDTRVEKRQVVDEALIEQGSVQVNPLEPLEARGQVDLPRGAMHSFKAEKNEIAWFLQVDCDIPRWPDYHFVYPLRVLARWDPPSGEAGTEA